MFDDCLSICSLAVCMYMCMFDYLSALPKYFSSCLFSDANNILLDAFEQLQYLVEDLNHARGISERKYLLV